MKERKIKGTKYIEYDYESALNESYENLNEFFQEYIAKSRFKCVYACKEIRAGNQLEIEIYPEFTKRTDIPAEAREKRKEVQKNLNNKNAIKYCQRMICENFSDEDIWLTLTYTDENEPQTWQQAIKNVSNYIRRINYARKKKGLPKCRYLYVTEHDPEAHVRWHHHIIMDGALDREICEKSWKLGERNQSKRLEEDRYGLVGMANYITKQKNRAKNEKRWNCSTGLKQFRVRKVHSKKKGGVGNYKPISSYIDDFVRDKNIRETEIGSWHPEYDFLESEVYYNGVNGMFYITARLREKGGKTGARSRPICKDISQRTSNTEGSKVYIYPQSRQRRKTRYRN